MDKDETRGNNNINNELDLRLYSPYNAAKRPEFEYDEAKVFRMPRSTVSISKRYKSFGLALILLLLLSSRENVGIRLWERFKERTGPS